MLDFSRVKRKEITLAELVKDLSVDDLRDLTNEMVDEMLEIIAGCDDEHVTFVPEDPGAYDPAAASAGEVNLPWTLGHVVVHATASAEESAFLAAELARGVEFHGRSRAEVPWETVTSIAQCRERLKESRRMRLASLDMWPDKPDLENSYKPWEKAQPMNAKSRFVSGLWHDYSHLEQIREIVRQACGLRRQMAEPV